MWRMGGRPMSSAAAIFFALLFATACAQGTEHTIKGDVLLSAAAGVDASAFAASADARRAAILAVMVGAGDKVILNHLVLSAPGSPADRVVLSFKMTSDSSGLSNYRAQRITRLLQDCEGISNRIVQYLPAASPLALNAGRCYSGAALMLHEVEVSDVQPDTSTTTTLMVMGIGFIVFALGCFYGGTVEAAKMPAPPPVPTQVELGERLNPDDPDGDAPIKPKAAEDEGKGAVPELQFDIHDLGE